MRTRSCLRFGLATTLSALALFSLFAAFAFQAPPTSLRVRSYSLRIEPLTYSAEPLATNEWGTATFIFFNERNATLRLLPSEHSDAAEFVGGGGAILEIPPFGKCEIQVRFTNPNLYGRGRTVRYAVHTDDPKRPTAMLRVEVAGSASNP